MTKVLYNNFSYLTTLFDELYKVDRNDCFSIMNYENGNVRHFNDTDDIKEKVISVIKDTVKIVEKTDYTINPEKCYVELHKYVVNGKTEPFFDFHEDDYGGVNYKTVTCIYYLRKDETIVGGDLEFMFESTIKIEPNMLVIFNGNKTHRVTTMDGHGVRKCMVLQFERLE